MKKILFVLALAACSWNGFAEDVIQVAPMKAAAGQGIDVDGELDGSMSTKILLCNSKEYIGVQFDINVPSGVLVYFDTEDCTRANRAKKLGKTTWLHSAVCSELKPSTYSKYDRYTVGIADQASNTAFIGNSGEDVCTMYFGVPSTLAPGVYPIYFTEIYYSNSKKELISSPDGTTATSYLIVGDATGELKLEGAVPSFVNTALAEETAISSLDLSKATAINGTFTYVPGRAVTAPAGVKANVTYKHAAAAADKYYSMNLPYDAVVECYTLKEIKGGNAEFESASSYTAGENVIVSNAVDYTWNNVDLKSVGEAKTGFYYIGLDGDKNVLKKYSGAKTTAHTLYGTWEASAGSNLRIVVDGELTGISTADIEGVNESYDLQGRRVVNAKNGVYVVNGKKQIVK